VAVNVPGDFESRSGGRFSAGYNWAELGGVSLEGSILFLAEETTHLRTAPQAGTLIARPFFDVQGGAPAAEIVSEPGVLSGGLSAGASSNLYGGELNLRVPISNSPGCIVNLLGGVRGLSLHDQLDIFETSSAVNTRTVGADILTRNDQFASRDYFLGVQVGVDATWFMQHFMFELYGKAAVGNTREQVTIAGFTQAANFDGTVFAPTPGGLLAAPSNIGTYQRNRVGVVPEFGFRVGYCFGPHWRVQVGYTLLFWDQVARAADQIDPGVNLSQTTVTGTPGALVGPARPAFLFRQTDYMAQGVSFMLEYRY
jgi:hypothetical protein